MLGLQFGFGSLVASLKIDSAPPTAPACVGCRGQRRRRYPNLCTEHEVNIEAVLKAAGTSMDRVVKTTVFLTKMSDFAAMNEVYGKHFKESPPARSTVQVGGLAKDAIVEIEAVALLH